MGMRPTMPRMLFKVAPSGGVWTVQFGDNPSETYASKEEAKAAANKQARACQDAGTPCRVEITGELGFAAS